MQVIERMNERKCYFCSHQQFIAIRGTNRDIQISEINVQILLFYLEKNIVKKKKKHKIQRKKLHLKTLHQYSRKLE